MITVILLVALAAGIAVACLKRDRIRAAIRSGTSRLTGLAGGERPTGDAALPPTPAPGPAGQPSRSTVPTAPGGATEVPGRVTPLAPRPAEPLATKAICRSCGGEGYYLRNPKDRQRCPVCRGEGSRTLTVPPGFKICPDCQGIGNVEERSARASDSPRGFHKRARRCERCAGKGHVRDA